MTKLDTIIAVKDVEASAKWYHDIFGFNNIHGGDHIGVLKNKEEDIMLCLRPWEKDKQTPMSDPNITVRNGLIFYFRTPDWKEIKQNLDKNKWKIEEDIHLNENSIRQEFSFRDPDGNYITVSEYHEYEG